MASQTDITEHQRSVDALIDIQAQLASVINSTSDLIWSVDSEQFGLQMFNCALSDYFFQQIGIRLAVGMRPADLFPPGEYVELWCDFYRRAMREGAYAVEYLVYTRTRTLILNFNPLRRDDVIVGISVFGKDITAQKAAALELQRSETKFRTLYDSTRDAVLVLDTSSFLDCNQATLDVFGCASKDAFCKLHPADLSPPRQPCGTDSRALADQRIETALRTGSARFEWLHKRADTGAVFPAEILLSTMELDGRPLLQAVVRDITDRKRAEDEQKRLQRALRLLSDCNISLAQSEDEKALLSNICRLVVETGGYQMGWIGFVEQDAGKPVRPVAQLGASDELLDRLRISWEDAQDIGQDNIGLAIRTRSTQIDRDFISRASQVPWHEAARKLGYQACVALPLNDQKQTLGALVIYAADPGAFGREEVQLLEELASNLSLGLQSLRSRIQRDTAEEASRAKSAFLASMSHELRTPLNAIIGFAQLLDMGVPAPLLPEQKESVGHILNGGQHLLGLINDLLDLARIESDRLEVSIETIALTSVIEQAITLTAPAARLRRIDIRPDSTAGLYIRADEARVRQILLNLLSNAVKYNHERGQVTVTHETQGAYCRIMVIDNGPGIPADQQSKLFESFQRLGAERTTTEGTGIGLVICKKLAELMGGSIGFESTVGIGSRFWLDVPTAPANTVQTPAPTAVGVPDSAMADLHGRVLYVEDNLFNTSVMRMVFRQLPGVELQTAESAEAGLELVRSNPPDLVLMDNNLPGMSGLEAMKVLKADPQTCAIPIVAVTASAMPHDIQTGLEGGFMAYLTKPFDVPELIALVRNIMLTKDRK
ncbi:MAG: ATP-binding protein [Parasulfuritortus sp.]|nr:ATP-binding protein [Parasulfuritortus sp.]